MQKYFKPCEQHFGKGWKFFFVHIIQKSLHE
jgi:hypothetical protein